MTSRKGHFSTKRMVTVFIFRTLVRHYPYPFVREWHFFRGEALVTSFEVDIDPYLVGPVFDFIFSRLRSYRTSFGVFTGVKRHVDLKG